MVKVENKTQFNRVINGVMVKRGLNNLLSADADRLNQGINDPLVQSLVKAGQLVIESTQPQPAQASATSASVTEPVQDPDVANMNVADATNAINTISDKTLLKQLLRAESAGANRKGVVDVINARLK
ncbi:hypothetical protein [Lentilactobacillus sunkii]|uniref:Uncharacterized protein n=1 Tax=Lentilactobacillus sunkii DSM 19904 TaxID=1423808 RepID=A0A0R1L3T6_9LACO|nr:hypothetical protein [Lentilactobacillus sunkii]KRK87561.1 hypothetical protein FD17_GL000960 [Lentilactobacillus sunkii DSM 19904]